MIQQQVGKERKPEPCAVIPKLVGLPYKAKLYRSVVIPDLQLYAIMARNMSLDKIATIDTKSIFFFYFIRFSSN